MAVFANRLPKILRPLANIRVFANGRIKFGFRWRQRAFLPTGIPDQVRNDVPEVRNDVAEIMMARLSS